MWRLLVGGGHGGCAQCLPEPDLGLRGPRLGGALVLVLAHGREWGPDRRPRVSSAATTTVVAARAAHGQTSGSTVAGRNGPAVERFLDGVADSRR